MTDPETEFLSQLKSADAKQRLDALTVLVPDEGPVSIPHLQLVAGMLPSLLTDINPVALKKLYSALEEALRQGMVDTCQYSALCTPLIEKGFSHMKATLKDQAKDILITLAVQASSASSPGQPNVVIQSLLSGLSAKSPKVVTESAFCLQTIVERYGTLGMDVAPFVRAVAPTFQNKDLKVRRAAMRIAAFLAIQVGVEPIKAMLGSNMPKQYITAFEGVVEEVINDMQGKTGDDAGHGPAQSADTGAAPGSKRAIPPPVVVQRFTYDPFDDTTPTAFHLAKTWDKMITDKNWKERKQILDDQLKTISTLIHVDRAQLQIPQIFKQLKTIIDSDLSVAVVSASMRFAGALAILVGPLGPYASTSKLLVTACTNRLKERKVPIMVGYNLFMHSILVHSHKLADISADMWAVALPHKNSEVKEDSCRLLRTIWATAIVYNMVYHLGRNKVTVQLPNQLIQSALGQGVPNQAPGSNSVDYLRYKELEDIAINYLLNEGFPGAQKPLPEGTPVSGELSPGLQLKSRAHRERVCYNSILVQIPESSANWNDAGDFAAFNLVFDSLDKLLGDSSAVIRAPALKAFAFGVVAHISEILAVSGGTVDSVSQTAYNLIGSLRSRISAKDGRKQSDIMELIKKICMSVGRNEIVDIVEGRMVPTVGQFRGDGAEPAAPTGQPTQHIQNLQRPQTMTQGDQGMHPQPKLFVPPSNVPAPQMGHGATGMGGTIATTGGPGYSFAPPSAVQEQQNIARINKLPQPKGTRPGMPLKDTKEQEFTISTNPHLYQQRKASTVKWIIDPFNSEAPISTPARDELYHQLCQIIPASFVPDMFLKKATTSNQALLTGQQGVSRGLEAKFTGTSKSILDIVGLLRNAMLANNPGAIAQRDVLMKYIALLFCDGFAAPATPNTTQVKIACQITEDFINIMIENEVVLSICDLDYLFPVLLARLEQFNMIQLKVQITSLAERHVHITSFENIINVALMHLVGRNARIQIRQLPTKFAIVRFVSVMAEASRDNSHYLELSLAPVQSLLSIYKTSMNTDTYAFSEGHLSESYPKLRGGSARVIFITCLAAIVNACDAVVRGKLLPTIEKTLQNKDLEDFHNLVIPCQQNTVIEQIAQGFDVLIPIEPQASVKNDVLNGFSPAEHYANTSMRQMSMVEYHSPKFVQSINQASIQGPSILADPYLGQDTSMQSATTLSSQILSPQAQVHVSMPTQLGAQLNAYQHVPRHHEAAGSAAAPTTAAPAQNTAPTASAVGSVNKTTVSSVSAAQPDVPPSPMISLLDALPPLVDSGSISLISAKMSPVALHHSLDSTRTPTNLHQSQPRSISDISPFDDVLTAEILNQITNAALFSNDDLESHILALKRATYLASTNQINIDTILTRLINAVSGLCRVYLLCKDSKELFLRKLRLITEYAKFMAALCRNHGAILCATKSAIIGVMTDMVIFMVLLAGPQPEMASYCYSALIDMMQSYNLSDMVSCLVLLASRVIACEEDQTSDVVHKLCLLNNIPKGHGTLQIAPDVVSALSSGPNSLIPHISSVLTKLISKVRGPSLELLLMAHKCRLDVATHIFKCSDLLNQNSLYTVVQNTDNIIVDWKTLSTQYPDFILTVAKNTCPVITTIPDILPQPAVESTAFVLEDVLQALNVLLLTTSTSSRSSLLQDMVTFVKEICAALGADIYIYMYSSIQSPLKNLISDAAVSRT